VIDSARHVTVPKTIGQSASTRVEVRHWARRGRSRTIDLRSTGFEPRIPTHGKRFPIARFGTNPVADDERENDRVGARRTIKPRNRTTDLNDKLNDGLHKQIPKRKTDLQTERREIARR
jgi:hypothetical protein